MDYLLFTLIELQLKQVELCHWCKKGHIVHVLEGEFVSELQNGERFTLKKGMTYVVSDELSSHRSSTESGVKVIIIDGDFLKLQ